MAILRSTDAVLTIEDNVGTQTAFELYAEEFSYTRNGVIVDVGGTSNLNSEKLEVGGAENMLSLEVNLDSSIATFMINWVSTNNRFDERTFFLYPNKNTSGNPKITGELGVSTWDWNIVKGDRQMMSIEFYINSPALSLV